MSVSMSTMLMPKRPMVLSSLDNFRSEYLTKYHPCNVKELTNGFKVATERCDQSTTATVGLYSRSGSRFDIADNSGCAHLLQQALWKGTQTQNAAQLKAALAAIGSKVECDSGRELQSMKITCLKEDVPAAMALLADVFQKPALDADSINAARFACIENAKEWENCVQTQIFQKLHSACYDSTDDEMGGGLGLSPMGNNENVKGGLVSQDLVKFHKEVLNNARSTCLAVTGDVDEGVVQDKANQLFGDMPYGLEPPMVKRYVGGYSNLLTGSAVVQGPEGLFNHTALGWEICGAKCQDTIPLKVLCETYGGSDRFMHDQQPNVGARWFYEACITQAGYMSAPDIHPFFTTYSDTGLMGFFTSYKCLQLSTGYLACNRAMLPWLQYCRKLTNHEANKGKNMYKAKLLFERNGSKELTDIVAGQLLQVGRVMPIEETCLRVDALTTQIISDVIDHYYYNRPPVMASWGVHTHIPPYTYMAKYMWSTAIYPGLPNDYCAMSLFYANWIFGGGGETGWA